MSPRRIAFVYPVVGLAVVGMTGMGAAVSVAAPAHPAGTVAAAVVSAEVPGQGATVSDVALPSALEVSGFAQASAPFSVRLQGPSNVPYADKEWELSAIFEREGAKAGDWPRTLQVDLDGVGMRNLDGVYRGRVTVTAGYNGTWKLRGIYPRVPDLDSSVVDLYHPVALAGANVPRMVVAGSHIPRIVDARIDRQIVWAPNLSYTLQARVVDATTGKPFSTRVPVYVGHDVAAGAAIGRGKPATYAAAKTGRFTVKLKYYSEVALLSPKGTHQVGFEDHVALLTSPQPKLGVNVTARPSTTRARVNQRVAVRGTVVNRGSGFTVRLQRQYSPNTWRTVSQGTTTSKGTFTVTAQPPRKGTTNYRVYVERRNQAGYSATFRVRAS